MWSQGRFRSDDEEHDHMPSFGAKAAELGFSHAEINYVIPPAGVDALIESNHVQFSSVHSPCPRVKMPNGKMSDALNLAAADEDERKMAVEVAKASVETAVRAGASLLVVHLGGIDAAIFEEERQLRKLFDAGEREGEKVEILRRRAATRRAEEKPRFFPKAKQSLAEIAEYAAPRGVAVGLENRYHFHEFPDPDELGELLGDYPADAAGFWLDVGHAEVLDRLGLGVHERWLDENGSRCIGTHVHDVDGLADHRPPGHGTADWVHYASKIPPDVPRVFEVNQRMPEEQLAAGIGFLRGVGVLPAV
jgi:sugar phosphate isomerase/epimerase